MSCSHFSAKVLVEARLGIGSCWRARCQRWTGGCAGQQHVLLVMRAVYAVGCRRSLPSPRQMCIMPVVLCMFHACITMPFTPCRYEVLQRLRAMTPNTHLPIIMVSAQVG